MFLAKDIVKAEEPPNREYVKRLDYIWEHTTEDLNVPLSIVEAYYIPNAFNLNKNIELRDNDGHVFEMPVYKIKRHLDDAYIQIREIVRKVAIRYSIDIPFKELASGQLPDSTLNTDIRVG